MAYKPPTTPTSDPMQKGPILQGANDKEPYVGKPKPMPKPAPRPAYGSSDGSGFDFQKYLAGQHRPRPVQILPGQGQGPMPVGTKPLPNPVVKDPRTGGGLDQWKPVHPDEWRGSWNPNYNDPKNPGGGGQTGGGGGGGNPYFIGDDKGGSSWNEQERGQPLPPGYDMSKFINVGMGPGGQDPMYGGAGTGPSYGGGPSGRGNEVNVGVKPQYGAPIQRGPGAPGGPPSVGTGPGSMGKPQQPPVGAPPPGGGQRPHPNRPPQGRPPVNPQQMQQGAQELYNDNTIPHEFKGQLLQAAQSGDPQAFNDMLFNSNIPHETKLRLQQMFGYGGQMQSSTPDQGQVMAGVQDIQGGKGSPYYGAF